MAKLKVGELVKTLSGLNGRIVGVCEGYKRDATNSENTLKSGKSKWARTKYVVVWLEKPVPASDQFIYYMACSPSEIYKIEDEKEM